MIMSPLRLSFLAAAAVVVVAAGATFAFQQRSGESLPLSELPKITHIHGIAVDREDPSRLLLATHHGFFVVSPEGIATRVSKTRDDFMGFTPHPTDSTVLYASGHPERGGNLGFLESRDGGKTWRQLSKGIGGPVDFHQMAVNKADPKVIYGAYRGLQKSRDGGRTWQLVGPQPAGLIDLAASARDPETLYAATESALLISHDGGQSWQRAYMLQRPVSLVEVAPDGRVYAFVVGTGLIRTIEPSLNWAKVSRDFGDRILLASDVRPVGCRSVLRSDAAQRGPGEPGRRKDLGAVRDPVRQWGTHRPCLS